MDRVEKALLTYKSAKHYTKLRNTIMDIKSTKIELAKLILTIDDPDLIQKVHQLITHQTEDFWNTLTEEEQNEIKVGIAQLDRGEKTSFEEYLSKIS